MNYKKDYYKILGIGEKATAEELRASYRHLAKLHHPDKNPNDPSAEERFKEINEAYEVLSNEITRHVYDSFRGENKQTNQDISHSKNSGATFAQQRTTKTRTQTIKREKRVYVQGTIEVKFQGEPELANSYIWKWEQQFTIIPTEVIATLTSSHIYKNAPPREYQSGYSTAELFATPLKQPISCKVHIGNEIEYYQLDLHDIRVKDPILKDITKHGQSSFGTLEGHLYGYVLYQYDETVTEQYTEYAGATGHMETREESGAIFLRQQFYSPGGGTYWTEWARDVRYGRSSRTNSSTTSVYKRSSVRHADLSWPVLLVILVILIILWPPLIYALLILAGWTLLILLVSWIIAGFRKIVPILSLLLIGALVALAIRSYTHKADWGGARRPTVRTGSINSTKTVVYDQDKPVDSLITHLLRWQDLDSSQYQLTVSIPVSALHRSNAAHTEMNEQEYAMQGLGAVYQSMLHTDQVYLEPIANAFDSLARSKSLNKQQAASMIVSCIQSIPYALVVDKSCTANYADDYVNQILARCETDCCKGYSKFGVQSPIEFMADLKGDCDTRALLLYALLTRLHYNVALLTSNYYKHALIAVDMEQVPSDEDMTAQINGNTYYLWETTATGFGPGKIPEAISNLRHWNIALK